MAVKGTVSANPLDKKGLKFSIVQSLFPNFFFPAEKSIELNVGQGAGHVHMIASEA